MGHIQLKVFISRDIFKRLKFSKTFFPTRIGISYNHRKAADKYETVFFFTINCNAHLKC